MYVQDGEFGRSQCQEEEESDADDETDEGAEVASREDHQTIPPTHYRIQSDFQQSVIGIHLERR